MTLDSEFPRLVEEVRAGRRAALEDLCTRITPKIYGLALRMLWNPEDAQDATQEILFRIITRLETFRAESAFETWAYRVAANYLLTFRESQLERQRITFAGFASDLEEGLEDVAAYDPVDALLLEEVRIGCTMAMLSCLDRGTGWPTFSVTCSRPTTSRPGKSSTFRPPPIENGSHVLGHAWSSSCAPTAVSSTKATAAAVTGG